MTSLKNRTSSARQEAGLPDIEEVLSSMKEDRQDDEADEPLGFWPNLALIALPFWGVIVLTAIASVLPRVLLDLFQLLALFTPLAGLIAIVKWSHLSKLERFAIGCVYLCVSIVVVFFVAWASLCAFGLPCN